MAELRIKLIVAAVKGDGSLAYPSYDQVVVGVPDAAVQDALRTHATVENVGHAFGERAVAMIRGHVTDAVTEVLAESAEEVTRRARFWDAEPPGPTEEDIGVELPRDDEGIPF